MDEFERKKKSLVLKENYLFLFDKKLAFFSGGGSTPHPWRTCPLKMQDFFYVLPNGFGNKEYKIRYLVRLRF